MEKTFDKNSVMEKRGAFVNASDEQSARASAGFCRLYELIRILRAPDGCPWDREQTPLSMRKDLIEEVFEAVDAISEQNPIHAKEELGDVFLNTLMVTYMYSQNGDFAAEEVFDELAEKLIRRHPHVFENSQGKACETEGGARTSGQVLSQWDRIKESLEGRSRSSILDEVPAGFPPLLKAFKMQKKAAKKGFDWNSASGAREKIFEELEEVSAAASEYEKNTGNTAAQRHLEEETGDLFFAVVNYARKLGVDPETALNSANSKFYRRFSFVEKQCAEQGVEMVQKNLDRMDEFWNEAKKKGL